MFPLIQLNELPRHGKVFAGETREDIFQLTGEDAPRFVPPLVFDLTVRLEEDDIVVEGSASALFEIPCARCLGRMPWRVALDDYRTQDERDGVATLDLTAQIREDMLLALPGYPRCEESNVEPRPCPAADRFADASAFIPLADEETEELPRPNPWGELDRIRPEDSSPS